MAANEVRKPPIGAVYALHLPRERGKCDWCGLPCEERTPVRKQLRQTHYACSAEIQLITNPNVARWHVEKRDHGICVDCGEDWSQAVRLVPDFYVSVAYQERYETSDRVTPGPDGKRLVHLSESEGYAYVSLKGISLWHVDHKIPLWKVRHMPEAQRVEYFKLHNLITRCEPCHKIKSRKESSERAHYRALAEPTESKKDKKQKPRMKRPWAKRKMQNHVDPWGKNRRTK